MVGLRRIQWPFLGRIVLGLKGLLYQETYILGLPRLKAEVGHQGNGSQPTISHLSTCQFRAKRTAEENLNQASTTSGCYYKLDSYLLCG